MNRRIFIAINLPSETHTAIRDALQADKNAYAELYEDARITPEQDWHITLLFLGDQPESALPTIERAIVDAMQNTPSPSLGFRMLTTAPPQRPPSMVWTTTTAESNNQLEKIKGMIIKNLAKQGIYPQGEQFAGFTGHVTLARLPKGRRIPDHAVAFAHAIAFQPKTVELMESQLKNTGAEYTTIKSIDFGTPI